MTSPLCVKYFNGKIIKKKYINDIECDAFNGSYIYSFIGIFADAQTILDPPTHYGLSFSHNCVNGIGVEVRIDEMRHVSQRKPLDIIGISETKFTNDMPTSNFDIDGWELFRAERKKVGKKPGGECALYINDNVNFNEKPVLIPQNIEGICGVVAFPNKYNFIDVANKYRLPKEKISWLDKMDK